MTRIATIAALVAFAGSASAQFSPGSLLFVTDDRTGGSDSINVLDYNSLTQSNLYNFAAGDQDTARHGGLAQGPDGEWYVANSPLPALDPSTASIERIDGLFGGAPSQSTAVSAPSLQNVSGLVYDSFTDSLLVLNNPGSNPAVPREFEGLQSYDRSTGAYDGLLVAEDFVGPSPRPEALGGGFVASGRAPGDYYFMSANGGADFDAGQGSGTANNAAAIFGLTLNDSADPLNATDRDVQDLSPSATGGSDFISEPRSMDVLPNGNIIFSDLNTRAIYELEILGDGSAGGLTKIVDLFPDTAPSDLIYNPFTGKINYVEFTGAAPGAQEIIEINLDGSGRTVLATGLFNSGSLVAIPAPASAMLLGLGGLAAVRRRR